MEQNDIRHIIEEGPFLEDLERMTDEQLSRWMADEERMADCELLAGYRESAVRENGRKPDHERAWKRIAERTVEASRQSVVQRLPSHGTLTFRLVAWLAAAVAVLLLVMIPMLKNMDDGDAPTVLREKGKPTPVVASVAKNILPDVLICSGGHVVKAGDSAAGAAHEAITESEADFSKADYGDATTTTTVFIPRGKLYKVTLSDGTEVWLNADSRLFFPVRFNGKNRQVEVKGEAYFKVAKDASHPFIVRAGSVSTTVLGTEFNFRSYGSESPEIALVKGSVVVSNSLSRQSVKLVPGQAATVGNDRISVSRINTDYYTQWKEGLFYFDDASLLDVMKELGRWYNINIEIEDPTLARYNIHFIASRDESLEQIVSDLNFFSYLNVSKKGDKLIISSKKAEK